MVSIFNRHIRARNFEYWDPICWRFDLRIQNTFVLISIQLYSYVILWNLSSGKNFTEFSLPYLTFLEIPDYQESNLGLCLFETKNFGLVFCINPVPQVRNCGDCMIVNYLSILELKGDKFVKVLKLVLIQYLQDCSTIANLCVYSSIFSVQNFTNQLKRRIFLFNFHKQNILVQVITWSEFGIF